MQGHTNTVTVRRTVGGAAGVVEIVSGAIVVQPPMQDFIVRLGQLTVLVYPVQPGIEGGQVQLTVD